MSRSALLAALASGVLTAVAQYVGVTRPAVDGYAVAERMLDKREAQIERRELRIVSLEDALETCTGRPVARGVTPARAARAAEASR